MRVARESGPLRQKTCCLLGLGDRGRGSVPDRSVGRPLAYVLLKWAGGRGHAGSRGRVRSLEENVDGMMEMRATVAKIGAEEVDFARKDGALLMEGLGDTEPPPPSGNVARIWGARSTARGRLEVATIPDVVLNGVSLDLSRLHSRILAALLESDGPVSTARLGEIVWQGRFVSEHTVHSQIALLRIRMLDFGLRIRNVRGQGYVLE